MVGALAVAGAEPNENGHRDRERDQENRLWPTAKGAWFIAAPQTPLRATR